MVNLSGLEEKWEKLCLNEEEQVTIVVGDDVSEEGIIKERRSLIGKILSKRNISQEKVRSTMGKIWRISK